MLPEWIWFIFIFCLGCCVGSFLNVVIYRLPLGKSLSNPPSSCPKCGKKIKFYDNIPILSWIILRGKCRFCGNRISPRYLLIELITGILFLGLFYVLFFSDIRQFEVNGYVGQMAFLKGGWLIYLIMIILISGLLASSAIDLQLWIIPISLCLLLTTVGILGSFTAPFLINIKYIQGFNMLPTAGVKKASLALGAFIGTAISLILLKKGYLKQSYDIPENLTEKQQEKWEKNLSHRKEMLTEILFLLPIIFFAFLSYLILVKTALSSRWTDISQYPPVSGFLGSLFGYFSGCAVVWATRILGTLAFGKEAMGLGDVHLMGAAGTVLGPLFVIIAFFIAPFFGLLWAFIKMFFRKSNEIPYGPFLSLAVLTVIILHDWIFSYIQLLYYH